MEYSASSTPIVPPEVLRYLKGAPPESRQFDFLIGEWDVDVTRYQGDGSVLMRHRAGWSAKYLNEGRMIIDDFKPRAPTGQDVASIVTLRTYSVTMRRWEMTFLTALEPAMNAEFHGEYKDGEMLLEASGRNQAGNMIKNRIRFFDIEPDSFNWESRISQDDGKTWNRMVTLTARRALQ